MSSEKTRIKDIARIAGVSIGTVDRVIHNRGEVAEKTKQNVLNILKETNYSPNVMAQALKTKKRIRLVSLLPAASKDNSFWKKHNIGIKRALDELEPFPVSLTQITFDIQSEEDFQEKTKIITDLNPDGVLFAPIFMSQSVSFCSRLGKIGIPFVFIDGYLENTDFLGYVGEDIFQSGRVAAQLIDMITPENSDILIVTIARNIRNVHHLGKRREGFLSYFKNQGRNVGRKILLNIPDPSTQTVTLCIDRALKDDADIRSIFITGSRSYLIANYLQKKGIKSMELVGYDLLETNVKSLKTGLTRFLIGQRPDEQAYKGVKKLFEYLSLHKIPDKFEYLPVDIVTSENVDYFI